MTEAETRPTEGSTRAALCAFWTNEDGVLIHECAVRLAGAKLPCKCMDELADIQGIHRWQEFLDAARSQATLIDDKWIISSYLGGHRGDWDLDGVIEAIRRSDEVQWVHRNSDAVFYVGEHRMRVKFSDGNASRHIYFKVANPADPEPQKFVDPGEIITECFWDKRFRFQADTRSDFEEYAREAISDLFEAGWELTRREAKDG